MLYELQGVCTSVDFKVNIPKTKIMINLVPSKNINFGDNEVELVVEKYLYFGKSNMRVTENNTSLMRSAWKTQ